MRRCGTVTGHLALGLLAGFIVLALLITLIFVLVKKANEPRIQFKIDPQKGISGSGRFETPPATDPKPSADEHPALKAFDTWFDAHKAKCKECGGSPNQSICMEAFLRWQEALKKAKRSTDVVDERSACCCCDPCRCTSCDCGKPQGRGPWVQDPQDRIELPAQGRDWVPWFRSKQEQEAIVGGLVESAFKKLITLIRQWWDDPSGEVATMKLKYDEMLKEALAAKSSVTGWGIVSIVAQCLSAFFLLGIFLMQFRRY